MTRNSDFTVAGHLCLDLIPELGGALSRGAEQIFRPGELTNVGRMVFSLGGPVANTGIGLQIFGNTVGFMARVGDDPIGQIIIELLASYGETTGIKISPGEESSYTLVIAPRGLDRSFLHYTGTNDSFCLSDVDFDTVATAGLFHFGYPPLLKNMFENQGEELASLLRKVKNAGATTSVDMSLPDSLSPSGAADWKKILTNVLPYVDIFLPSIEEALYALDREKYLSLKVEHPGEELIGYIDPAEYSIISEQFLSFGCKMTALKSGFRGWYFRTSPESTFAGFGKLKPADYGNWADRELWCPAFEIEHIASATGSGDSSIAGFLSAFSKGYRIEECLKYANGAGYQNLKALDAISGLTSWNGLTRLVESKNVVSFPMTGACWEWNEEAEMWERPTPR